MNEKIDEPFFLSRHEQFFGEKKNSKEGVIFLLRKL